MPTDSAKKQLSAWERRKLYSNQLREHNASTRFSSATSSQLQSNHGSNRAMALPRPMAPPRPRGRPREQSIAQVKNRNRPSLRNTSVQLSSLKSVESKPGGGAETHKYASTSQKKMPKRTLRQQSLGPSQRHIKGTGGSGPSTSTSAQPKVTKAAPAKVCAVKRVVLKPSLIQNLASTQKAEKKQAERDPKTQRSKELHTEEMCKLAPKKNIAKAKKGEPYVQPVKVQIGHGPSGKHSHVCSRQTTGPSRKEQAVTSVRPTRQRPSDQIALSHSVKRNVRRSTLVTNSAKRRLVHRSHSNASCVAQPMDKFPSKTQSEATPVKHSSPSCSSTTIPTPLAEGFQKPSTKSSEFSEQGVSVNPKRGAPAVKDTREVKTATISVTHVATPENSFCNVLAERTPFAKSGTKGEPVTSTRSALRTRKRILPSSSTATTPSGAICEMRFAKCPDPSTRTPKKQVLNISAGGMPFKRTPSSEESGDSFKTAADNTADMENYSSIENDDSHEDLNDTFTLEEPHQLRTPEVTPQRQRGLPAPLSCLKKGPAASAAKKSVSFSVPSRRGKSKTLPKTPRRSRTIKESLDAWLAARGITLSRHSCCFQESRSTPHSSSSAYKRRRTAPEESFKEQCSLDLDISSLENASANNVPKKASLPDILSELQDCLNKEVAASDVEQWLCQLEDNVPNVKDYSGFWICRCLIHESAGNHTQALESLTEGLDFVKSGKEELTGALNMLQSKAPQKENVEPEQPGPSAKAASVLQSRSRKNVNSLLEHNMFASTIIDYKIYENPRLKKVSAELYGGKSPSYAVMTPVRRSSRHAKRKSELVSPQGLIYKPNPALDGM